MRFGKRANAFFFILIIVLSIITTNFCTLLLAYWILEPTFTIETLFVFEIIDWILFCTFCAFSINHKWIWQWASFPFFSTVQEIDFCLSKRKTTFSCLVWVEVGKIDNIIPFLCCLLWFNNVFGASFEERCTLFLLVNFFCCSWNFWCESRVGDGIGFYFILNLF